MLIGQTVAKPDTDDGYLKLAHELHAAISAAGFNRGESIVLREVFDQIYGSAKRRIATLSPSDLAARIGGRRQHVSRDISNLADSGILARVDGPKGRYRFIKDYETWTENGEPRFTPELLEWIRSHNPKHKSKKEASVTKSGYDVLPELVTSEPNLVTSTNLSVTKSGDNLLPNMVTNVTNSGYMPASRLIGTRGNKKQELQEVDVVVGRAHETPKSQSIVDQVHAMILAKSTDPEHMPRGNEQLAEDIAMKASGWVRDGLSPSAILEAYRLACEAVENPWKVQPYAAKVVRSLDNKLKAEAAAPTARPSPSTVPIGLSPAELRRQAENEALRARFGRKEPASG